MTTKALCTAMSKHSMERCRRYPADGATVCINHGGGSPQARRKAAERVTEQNLRKQHSGMRKKRVEDPLTELQKLAGEVIAWKELLSEKVQNLTEMRYEGTGNVGEQLRSEVGLFERAMDRCTNTLSAIAKLDIDERLVSIKEREADLFEQVMMRTFAKMGLDDEQRARAGQIVAAEILAINSVHTR